MYLYLLYIILSANATLLEKFILYSVQFKDCKLIIYLLFIISAFSALDKSGKTEYNVKELNILNPMSKSK